MVCIAVCRSLNGNYDSDELIRIAKTCLLASLKLATAWIKSLDISLDSIQIILFLPKGDFHP